MTRAECEAEGLIVASLLPPTQTATPLLFSYRIFTCDDYYLDHPPYDGKGDRCAVKEIETRTAQSISVMVALSTVSRFCPPSSELLLTYSLVKQLAGVLNLFVTTYQIKHWGVKVRAHRSIRSVPRESAASDLPLSPVE